MAQRLALGFALLVALVVPLAACSSGSGVPSLKRAAFSSSDYGVSASPRLSRAKNPPKGGGRYIVGKPYTVAGRVYTPVANPVGYVADGEASWYGDDFHGRQTANGEIFSANAISGAHPTLPLPCYVRVTSLETGRSIVVRVNDRGPYLPGRVMDLSYRAAAILGYAGKGTGEIEVKYIGPAPLKGDDTRMLLASLNRVTPMEREATRFAMTEPKPRARTNEDPIADVINLFGYAESGQARADIDSAHAAVDAMATRSVALEDWVDRVDDDARAIRLELGTFTDAARAEEVELAFAVLGAVDEAEVRVPAGDAERLTLTHLKPGVARNDVVLLARELGLTDLVLY